MPPGAGTDAAFEHCRDRLMNLSDGAIAVNHGDTLRLALGDLAVLVENAAEERNPLLLKAIFVIAGGTDMTLVAESRPIERPLKIRQQQDGQVRLEISAQAGMQVENDLASQLASASLVGLSGIRETVAENDVALRQRRPDHLCDRLGAVGEHQTQFGQRREVCGAGVQQQAANGVSNACAAGLARRGNRLASRLQPFLQEAELRTFPRAVQALEGNKKALRHGASVLEKRLLTLSFQLLANWVGSVQVDA
jgi:hypothetical protein